MVKASVGTESLVARRTWLAAAGAAVAALALPVAATAQTPMTEGQVRRIDPQARKITLTHGEIKNLDMPPMTMVFDVRPGVEMDKIKAGDMVRFRAELPGGKFTVTALELAR